MKSILILGGGVMQGPAIRIAREKGYAVHVADGNPGAVHAKSADVFHHIDLKDKEALARAAAGIDGLAGVFTAGTDFSASVAWVANSLGLPGIPYDVALDASDKARMRARLAMAGVPVPPFAYGGISDDPVALAARVAPLPLVVKPVDNMGARGCRLARSEPELREAWSDAVTNSRSGRAIMEAYLDGPEFSIDAVVHDGHIIMRGIADRIITFKPFFVEMGHTMPTAYGSDIVDEVVSVFKAGVEALGIRTGAAKGDIKYTRQGAFVGEIAARLSGGYMSGWTYPYSSGVEVTAEAMDIACGAVSGFADPAGHLVCAERAWISIPGSVVSVVGLDIAEREECVRDLFPRAASGDRVVFPCNNVEKCGNAIALSSNRLEAERAAESAARSVLLRLAPGDGATEAFLRGVGRIVGPDGSTWPPAAYQGLSAMTLAEIAGMPAMLRSNATAGGSVGSDSVAISIAPLRDLDIEPTLDWQGRTLRQTMDAVTMLTGARLGLEADVVLGSVFWNAVIAGGYQAGAWIVDTTRARLEGTLA